ncbi:MAG: class I SAM-dependent methyltransferase family protein [Candidatus Thorarchaeota archaeon]
MGGDKKNKKQEILNRVKKEIPADLLKYIPNRWWFIGDILVTSIPEQLFAYKEIIGEAFLFVENKRSRTVLGKIGPTVDIIRSPAFEIIAGEKNTETVHKELNTLFKIDAAKLTFSPGNHGEKERLLCQINENEIIIDMFACVGNLSLPIAVNKSPKQIIASEINPIAYHYLVENIKLNKVENKMIALLGDNREILIPYFGQADRVLSGFFNSDENQNRIAIKLCKKQGIIHFHRAISNLEINDMKEKLLKLIKEEKRIVETFTYKRVKKYSPGINHIVFDVVVI